MAPSLAAGLTGITCVILSALKTSISLPDHLFRLAEATARKLRMSRSQLYAAALAEYLERCNTSKVTERLNAIYSTEPANLDPALASAQLKSLEATPGNTRRDKPSTPPIK